MAGRGWLLLLALLLWRPLPAAEDAEEAAAAKNVAMLQRLKDNAAARRAAAQRVGARRAAVRVSAKQAGDLDVDKLNAMLANEAFRVRRQRGGLGTSKAALSRNGTVASASRGVGVASVTASASPIAASAGAANAVSANVASRASLVSNGQGGARRGYDFAFPVSSRGGRAGLSRADRAAVQKAVEAALDKREAESFTGRLRQWLRKLVPVAEKTATAASAAAALR